MKKTLSALAAFAAVFACSSAHANDYARYMMGCTFSATMQTMSSAQEALPHKVKLTATFVEVLGENTFKKMKTSLTATSGHDLSGVQTEWDLKPETVQSPCNGHGAILNLGALSAKGARELLVAMGGGVIPELSQTSISLPSVFAGRTHRIYNYRGPDRCDREDQTTYNLRVAQIHFSDKYDGLSYHLIVDSCYGYYIDQNGTKTRFGGWPSRTGD